jgi:putative transposase
MARENASWGRRRIQAELRFLGYEVAEITVAKYMRRPSPPAIRDVACLPRGAYSRHSRRRLLRCPHAHLPFALRVLDPSTPPSRTRPCQRHLPTAAWAAHQLVESFPEETALTYLLRDRDAIYGDVFARRVKALGMREILIAPRAPWQNPFAARLPA